MTLYELLKVKLPKSFFERMAARSIAKHQWCTQQYAEENPGETLEQATDRVLRQMRREKKKRKRR